ncbi:hypothetical protein JCM14108_1197 [Lentilactobacillus farraginis DSM 18382 = JCM 14108]|uniref:Uncharacterized protein n=1 Tax=Lentilactobacillus farraginis DSM 18382 = JCM 14108 TaxID=1423743 RepID=X0PA38_9LACO|nr:hypothetical protein JCM14108_1197 [Lentilactobacillus farraginis DSM 18382 = JCM 14108]
MNYASFLLRKVIKSKLFIVSVSIIIVIIVACLALNLRNKDDQTLASNSKDQITFDTRQIKRSAFDKTKANRDNIKLTQKDRQMNRRIQKMTKIKKWRSAYRSQIAYNNWQLQSENNSRVVDRSLVNLWMSEIYRCHYLYKLNLPEQSRSSPTTGISFAMFVDQMISSVLIPLLIIFNFGLLYTRRFGHNVDKDRLLPMSIKQSEWHNLSVGYTVAGLFVLIAVVTSLLAASLISGFGNWRYPIAFYTPKLPFNIYVSQGSLVLPTLILRILSACFIVTCVYCIATLTKQVLSTVLISTLMLIGTSLVTPDLKLLAKVGQYLPTSYFNGVNVTSGQLAYETRNIQFSYIHGVVTLFIWIVVLMVISYVIQRIRQRYYDNGIAGISEN